MSTAGGIFLTGTDTEVGKTRVATGLLHAVRHRGYRVAGYKPVAAGCELTPRGWRNEDALAHLAAAGGDLDYEAVNPVALPAAMAPHLAAEDEDVSLALDPLVEGFRDLAERVDWVLVEGAGGWRVPLNDRETLADLAVALGLPVVLVVAIRLGCINHALLSAEAIVADGLELAGWVANRVDDADPTARRQIESIARRLHTPLLGVVPESPGADADGIAACLDVDSLL